MVNKVIGPFKMEHPVQIDQMHIYDERLTCIYNILIREFFEYRKCDTRVLLCLASCAPIIGTLMKLNLK
jgi:hypothetical protein